MRMFPLTHDLLQKKAQWEKKYPMGRDVIAVGEKTFGVYQIKNADDILEEFIEQNEKTSFGSQEAIPYWGEVWSSAIGLAQYLIEEVNLEPGIKGLEIGCGLGLAGMAAAYREVDMVLTDYFSEPLDLLQLHWWEHFGVLPQTQQMDWRRPDPDLAADLVLAADIAYEARDFPILMKTLPMLVNEGGRLLLSEPLRTFAQPFIQSLSQIATVKELGVQNISDRNSRIAVYEVIF